MFRGSVNWKLSCISNVHMLAHVHQDTAVTACISAHVLHSQHRGADHASLKSH